jgi:catechol 2,3-dioxygenase-like lactoylglutathione lyase family enzyme
MKGPWNLGVKVKDLDADLAFLEACGATQIQKGTTLQPGGQELHFGMAFLGAQRLLLFPRVIYEEKLAEPLKEGIAHVVYEVDDVAEVLRRFKLRGIIPFWGPEDISTSFGRRRIVFFRSPSGFIFETFQNIG